MYVREGDSERTVGQYPDGTAEEALAYFVRKFTELEGQVVLLEQRIARGTAVSDVASTVQKLAEQLVEPNAVGDIASLRERVGKLTAKAEELTEQQKAEREKAKQAAIEARTAIVVAAEELAAQDPDRVQWKQTQQSFDQLFADWQAAQKAGPQLPKAQADALWKRFRTARQTVDSARRAFFAKMDAANKDVRHRKEQIIASAEALADQGAGGIPAYRNLLEDWKGAGRASRKIDDQLWARFKAAGDVLYGAKAEEVAQSNEEYQANLVAKEALLTEAEPLLAETDHETARKKLTDFQLRWDELGKVPREAIRAVEGRMRAIEDHVRGLQEAHWQATNPETIARSEGLRGQLEQSIAELQDEIAKAKAAGDAKAEAKASEALATQQSWLNALG